MIAACAAPKPKAMVNTGRSKEYFAETEYGVKASPRVTTKRSDLPRGGGRDQIGKPYVVKGKMYYPKEDPDYRKVGAASWYGDAFHGRLTANGEIYDMTHLTAAHPTMPLPSYARVTNVENGSSMIVRVNDRGPYAHGRLIDLSKRAAEMLGYAHLGTAKVEVEYLGRAPLHGQDDEFLLASYQPGASPADEIQPGVMIAMAGPTPTANAGASATPFPAVMQHIVAEGDPALPASLPLPPERPLPGFGITVASAAAKLELSYAAEPLSPASAALSAFARVAPHLPEGRSSQTEAAFVAVGTYASQQEAERSRQAVAQLGRAKLQPTEADGAVWYAVSLHQDGRSSLDEMLKAAWASGARDAMVVRD